MKKQLRICDVTIVSFYAFLSGFVYIEPSPAELFFIFTLPFMFRKLVIKDASLAVFLILSLSTILPSVHSYLVHGWINLRFIIIDFYLYTVFLIYSSIINDRKKEYEFVVNEIMTFWTFGVLLNILLYIFCIITGRKEVLGNEVVAFGLRLKGMFKDPNVAGPYIVVPTLYWMAKYFTKEKANFYHLVLMIILFSGVVFSFSRAAWINFGISFTVMYINLLLLKNNLRRTVKSRSSALLVFFAAVLLFSLLYNPKIYGDMRIGDFLKARLKVQKYDTDRLSSWVHGINALRSFTYLGLGTGNFEKCSPIAAHQTYIRFAAERGFSSVYLIIFLSATIIYKKVKVKNKEKCECTNVEYIVVKSALLGSLINGMFIDAYHWRHLWVLLAMMLI